MRRGRPTITEFTFFLSGVLIVILGWAADLLGSFEVGSPPGHGPDRALPLRLFMTIFGVAFATIGIAYENFPRILADREMATRSVLALLFLADGSLHLYALNDHLGEPLAASFFAVFSGLQLSAGFAIPYLRRRLDVVWLAMTVFLIGAYVATRTAPVWPIGVVEEVDALGVVSKIVEVGTVVAILSLLRGQRAARSATGSPAAGGR